MPWYKSGTVSVTQNSNAVIGIGTAFIANSRVGDGFRGPDGGWYEVTNIASDTALAIDPPYQGATNAAGSYALAPLQGYVKDSADALRALVNQFGGVLAVLGDVPTRAGVREALNLNNTDGVPEGETNKYLTNGRALTMVLTGLDPAASGAVVATDTIIAAFSKLQKSKAAAGANSDITELNGLTKPITAAQGGVSDGYLDGLIPSWNSSSSITISSGAAFIQGSGKVLRLPSAVTLTGIGSLTADIFYYVYLYDNVGIPSIEISAVVPAAPYSGTSRSKTGDTSRRFVCALRSGSGGTLYGFQVAAGIIYYLANTSVAPFRRLASGTSTSYVSVSLSSLVPPTTQTAVLRGSSNTGVAALANPLAANTPLSLFDAGSRYQLHFPTGSDQSVQYVMLSAGNFTLDVCGYGMDR
ncbi:hypothetical protein FHW68_000603 [Pseudomonas sp. Tn43]|uniref:hypothetical protein n=1 Tax=Pseudomonas sp. Tn43 TaxID=701213 RepID=UPI00179BFB05|nr:hypothetical protein [Pseudomonas sp. Tn43]MBB3239131.1 hypothetical protein [Pseudomonas sp. Tn43]